MCFEKIDVDYRYSSLLLYISSYTDQLNTFWHIGYNRVNCEYILCFLHFRESSLWFLEDCRLNSFWHIHVSPALDAVHFDFWYCNGGYYCFVGFGNFVGL